MAKLRIFCILAFIALFSVQMAVIRGKVMKQCYNEMHPEIICENGITVRCSVFCKKKFGPSTTVQCISSSVDHVPFCVCKVC
ncbi:hypothetical protein ACS0TY_007536 [Phlomoides rotata]